MPYQRPAFLLLETPVPKPIIKPADVLFDDIEDNGYYTSRRAMF